MEKYVIMIAATSFAMSGVILGLILFNNLFSGKYSAKWRYYMWFIVLLGLLVPFRPDIILPFEPVHIFDVLGDSEYIVEDNLADSTHSAGFSDGIGHYPVQSLAVVDRLGIISLQTPVNADKFPKGEIIFTIWLAGAMFVIGFYLWRNKQFSVVTRRWRVEISDSKILSVLQRAREELGIKEKVYVQSCRLITSPMLAGFIKPVIFLPDKTIGEISEEELLFIFKHELVHYKRRDLWTNLLVIFVKAIHWFNPFAHIMAAAIRNDCEISCDEAVVSGTSLETRRIYGETIIGFIRAEKALKNELSINLYDLYGGKNTMKKRLMSIMDSGKKKTKIALLCAALVLTATFLSGFIFAVDGLSVSDADKVMETVLERTGGGTVVKCELDYVGSKDTGIRMYEVEVINGDTKYEIEIGADDLVIYGYEEKTSSKYLNEPVPADTDITPERAIEIALEKTGESDAKVEKWELNINNSKKVYKIEIIGSETKYSMNVVAADGTITNYKAKPITSNKEVKVSVSNNPALISAEEAKEIALAKTNGGKVDECELDYEKGVWVYEIEIILDRTEYDVEINAETGAIIKFEIDD